METTLRLVTKALTWQLIGLVSTTGLGYLVTGSWSHAGTLSLLAAGSALVLYVVHERLWQAIPWGRGPGR